MKEAVAVTQIRGRKLALTAAALQALRQEHTTTIEPARHRATEALALEQQINHLVNQAYALTPAETALLWLPRPHARTSRTSING